VRIWTIDVKIYRLNLLRGVGDNSGEGAIGCPRERNVSEVEIFWLNDKFNRFFDIVSQSVDNILNNLNVLPNSASCLQTI